MLFPSSEDRAFFFVSSTSASLPLVTIGQIVTGIDREALIFLTKSHLNRKLPWRIVAACNSIPIYLATKMAFHRQLFDFLLHVSRFNSDFSPIRRYDEKTEGRVKVFYFLRKKSNVMEMSLKITGTIMTLKKEKISYLPIITKSFNLKI